MEEFLYEKLDRKVPSRVTNGELLAQYMAEAASELGPTTPYGEPGAAAGRWAGAARSLPFQFPLPPPLPSLPVSMTQIIPELHVPTVQTSNAGDGNRGQREASLNPFGLCAVVGGPQCVRSATDSQTRHCVTDDCAQEHVRTPSVSISLIRKTCY